MVGASIFTDALTTLRLTLPVTVDNCSFCGVNTHTASIVSPTLSANVSGLVCHAILPATGVTPSRPTNTSSLREMSDSFCPYAMSFDSTTELSFFTMTSLKLYAKNNFELVVLILRYLMVIV